MVVISVPARSVFVIAVKLVTKNSDAPSVSTPEHPLNGTADSTPPGTTIVVAGTIAPVAGSYWLYVHEASPLLMRNRPFGRTVNPSASMKSGLSIPVIVTGPLRTAPVSGFSPNTCSGEVEAAPYPVNTYSTPPEKDRSAMPTAGRGLGS